MTKKQNRVRGFGKRTLSVVLSVLLILSTLVVVLTATSLSASAAISYWFVSGSMNGWTTTATSENKINSGTGGSVTIPVNASGINFKMVAVEDGNQHWCGVAGNEENVTISCYTKTAMLWDNETNRNMHLNLPANTESVTFTLSVEGSTNYVTATPNTSGGGTGGPDMSQMTYNAPVNTANSANTADNLFWANATYFDYESDKELTDGWLKPVQAGTKNFNDAIDEWYPFYIYNRGVVKAQADSQSDWAQPLYFGNFCDTNDAYKESSHHQGGTDSYGYREATNSSNVTRFVHIANNSDKTWDNKTALASMYCSYQGLVSSTLDSDGNLLLPNGQQAPYFNSSEDGPLRGYAKVVNSSFPFKVTDVADKNYKKYSFNSKNAKDNVYFTWATDGSTTYPTGVNYGAGTTYGVLDGKSRFMYNTTSGYGIFPFNNASNNYKGTKTNANEKLDYGFGIKTEMKFRVPAPSNDVNTAGDPIYFSFSGDDDLWMYITDDQGNSQLILDMGGDHKESTGFVNFNTLKATVDYVGSGGGSATKSFTFDYSKTYTMTVFYMERGLIESNCEMEFTMYPAGNQVNVEKEVDTTAINHTSNSTALQDAVAAIDQFGFLPYESESESGTYTVMKNTEYMHSAYGNVRTSSLTGAFPLRDGQNASFLSQFTTNDYVKVEEADPNTAYLRYTTTWSVSDPLDSSRDLTDQEGLTSSAMQLKNPSGEDYDYAQLDYLFVNTPKTGSVSVTKTMNSSASADRNKEFNAKVEISLTGATGTFTAYPLTYSASDKSGTFETDSSGNLSSSALLKHGRTITFDNLPMNAVVKVTEQLSRSEQLLYTPSYPGGNTVTVPDGSTGSIGITNTPITPDAVKDHVEGTKLLDDEPYTGDMFRFILEGIARFADDPANVQDTSGTYMETTSVANGVFRFDDLTFETEGVYRYHVYEDTSYLTMSGTTFDTDFMCFNTDYLVKFTVKKGTDNKLFVDSTEYYPYSRYEDTAVDDPDHPGEPVEHTMTSADFTVDTVEEILIENELNKGNITIKKENQKGEKVSGVTFGVYKVDEDIQLILDDSRKTDSQKYDMIMMHIKVDEIEAAGTGKTNAEGVAAINDLPIYEDGFVNVLQTGGANGIYVRKTDFTGYQKYILLEMSSETDGYSLNKTVSQGQVFSFPINSKYDFTFEYVNNQLKNPSTAGIGMTLFKVIGLALAVLSVLALGGYLLYTKKYTRRKVGKHFAD